MRFNAADRCHEAHIFCLSRSSLLLFEFALNAVRGMSPGASVGLIGVVLALERVTLVSLLEFTWGGFDGTKLAYLSWAARLVADLPDGLS